MKSSFTQQKKNTNEGFTIIETLVAIAILMIAIAGPLTIAHKGLLAANYAAQQVTASYLAQDAIEYVKNVRDNNIIKKENNVLTAGLATTWISVLQGCTKDNPCSLSTATGDPYVPTGITYNCGTCLLYKNDSGYTDSSSGNIATPFSRYFYISSPSGNAADEAKMVVIIKWKTGTIDNVFAYENEIFNVIR